MPSPHIITMDDRSKKESSTDRFYLRSEQQCDNTSADGKSTNHDTRKAATDPTYPFSLPPLRLHTPRGGELEIDSVFQRNLRVAKLCNLLGLTEVLTDWRFPKARVPSRPDFSRKSLPMFRHTSKATNPPMTEEPIIPSKYHVENLQRIEDFSNLLSDTVPAYVAAYLESAPRDPLAAEESSRKASNRVNEAAPRKMYLPIVNPMEMHEKIMEPTDIRCPPTPFQNWCFGCRLELGIQTLETHPTYDPFRDRPVRVGGGFAYMNSHMVHDHIMSEGSDHMTSGRGDHMTSGKGDHMTSGRGDHMIPAHMSADRKPGRAQRNDSDAHRKHRKVIYRPDDLPSIYRSGFVPFQPKKTRKSSLFMNALPKISEADAVSSRPLDPPQRDPPQRDPELSKTQASKAASTSVSEQDVFVEFKVDVTLNKDAQLSNADLSETATTGASVKGEREEGDILHNPADQREWNLKTQDQANNREYVDITCGSGAVGANDSESRNSESGSAEEGNDFDNSVSTQRQFSSESPVPLLHLANNEDCDSSATDLEGLLQQNSDELAQLANAAGGLGGSGTDGGESALRANSTDGQVDLLEPPTDIILQSSDKDQDNEFKQVNGLDDGDNSEENSDSMINNSVNIDSQSGNDSSTSGDHLAKTLQQAMFVTSYKKPSSDGSPEHQIDDSSEPASAGGQTQGTKSDFGNGEINLQSNILVANNADNSTIETELLKLANEAEDATTNTSTTPETMLVHYSPLLSEKPELRWVVKPLEIMDNEDVLVDTSSATLLPAKRTCDIAGVYEDANWLDMENNKVTATIISSKEYVPIWTISSLILEEVMEDVMKRIAKKKAPAKKVKVDNIKKPVGKVVEEVKADTPSPREPTPPPPPKEPTPPPKEPTPPPKEPTPPPPRYPTPIAVPKTPTPPPPPVPKPVELPPLPQVQQFATTAAVPRAAKPKALDFGTSLVSIDSRKGSASTTLSPSPIPSISPDYDFHIVPRSPTPPFVPVPPEVKQTVKLKPSRTLNSKVDERVQFKEGNDWTFRQRLNVPVVAPPPKPLIEEREMLPEIVKSKTPTPPPPVPSPVKRRIRKTPSTRTFAKVVKSFRKKSSRPAVNKKELKVVVDPLDYLAKYCLIHPERLPVYERIFKEVVSRQAPRFTEVYCVLDDELPPQVQQIAHPGLPHADLTGEQKQRFRNMAEINGVSDKDDKPAMNAGEFQVTKVNFTLDQLCTKYDVLLDQYEEMETVRDTRVATIARKLFPQILRPDYVVDKKTKKRSKKSGGKSKKSKTRVETAEDKERRANFVLNDAQVIERLSSDEKKQIELDEEVYRLKLKMNRLEVKILSAEDRMEELEAEKAEMQIWSQELYLAENIKSNQKPEFRRVQSALFNKLNPDMDEQMNFEEVEEALRTINGHLLTDKEMQFIYHILKIPGKKVINFKTFGCIAALSEKVQQLHPDIRKLINKFSFEALEVKMEKCKELYELLYEGETDKPNGAVAMRSLNVELLAGGLSDEHLDFVKNKFNRTQKGYLEYMDFLTYVPLFVELHDRICSNPLTTDRVS